MISRKVGAPLQMKAYARVITILIPFAMILSVCMMEGRMPQTSTRIHGRVVDDQRKFIVGAEVKVSGSGMTIQTLTDGSGTYSLEVKPGKYAIDAEKESLCPFHREPFVIQQGSSVEINFQLAVRTATHRIEMQGEEPPVHSEPLGHYCPGGYYYHDVPAQDGLPLGATIMSGLFESHGAVTEYESANSFGGFLQVVLTFDQSTIHANTLTYDSKKHIVKGNGAVTWEDGTGSVKSGSTIMVKIRAPRPIISIRK
jgi:hypothetical protein